MNAITKLFAFVLLILISKIIFSQNKAVQNDLTEKIIEQITDLDENLDYSSLLDEINTLLESPVNLNEANEDDLKKLYFLNQNQIKNLLDYRLKYGPILSIYELQLLPGFSMETARNIAPLISLQSQSLLKPNQKYKDETLLLKLEKNFEKEYGYKSENTDSKFLGDAFKYYIRYRKNINLPAITYGFTAEKDKGEPFFQNGNSKGFDFYSAHAQYKSDGFIRQINLGDYHVKFGQGLNIGNGMGNSKSSATTQNAKKYQGTKAYISSNENQFFRGISIITSPIPNTELAVWGSYKHIDASFESDSLSSYVTSVINTGLHRNRTEIRKKHALKEQVTGSYFIIDMSNFEIGMSFLHNQFSPELKSESKAHNRYSFNGNQNYNFSISYQTYMDKIHLFGESAKSKSGGLAFLKGANILVHPQLTIETIYRKFDKDYHAFYSGSFSENGNNQNEEGFYIGMQLNPIPKWTLKAYYDQFKFPWLSYKSNAPTNGHEYFAHLEYTPSTNLSVYLRYKQECKADNIDSCKIVFPVKHRKSHLRFHVSSNPAERLEIRNRLEFSEYRKLKQNNYGFLIYQDVFYQFKHLPLAMNLRYALFDTDSYDTRIYAYENNILYAYSVPAYYYKGSRFYINLNYKISPDLSCYARYSFTKYANTSSVGSGLSEVQGDTKSEFNLLLKFRF